MESFERDIDKAKEDFNQFVTSFGEGRLGEFADIMKKEIYSLQSIYEQSFESEREKVRALRNHVAKCDNLICEQRDKNKNEDYTPIARLLENLKYGIDEYESRIEEF